ncbi:hypothetical protein FOMG_19601 [Fusarium oxysporum f. sp. melonis 26406]|uniref:Uncharacterized protein n=2 Tax=Fusarium oxysporum species complex TaxID=171631 RepID=X0J0E6_FUSO5|nr:uncharacterized protein FOIG_16920 [Fusarium odoratissimum NRRL 54006]EXK23638.1 hypothetical protein FOMG_19601 [Fusarium oxysporum f. sp. melonis 26406]EXL89796.1 hypothetical protein FOIG_16920 [Fusarium odoratissimum NRRL 54006]
MVSDRRVQTGRLLVRCVLPGTRNSEGTSYLHLRVHSNFRLECASRQPQKRHL